jgi:DNA-binding IclR family transcriptional regulator
MKFNKSTTHALLTALKETGYVIFNPKNRKYSLGFKIVELADHILYQRDLRDICLPVMQELAEKIREDISLNIRIQLSRICIAVARGPQHVRLNITTGMSVPVYCGAAGKCLLAFMPADEVGRLLEQTEFVKFTDHTITDSGKLFEELTKIRRQEYAESREEFFNDAAALAFPLFDRNGQILAAYSVHSTVNRLTDETRDRFVAAGMDAARRTNTILKSLRQY